MRALAFLLLFAALASQARGAATTITLLHFSDDHAHVLPFFSEGRQDQGGVARAVALLRSERSRRGTLVFSGGDTMNHGSPAWSDRYRCTEWSWWNGIVDAMAFGNHDADYGAEAFARCRSQLRYPMLSANTTGADGSRMFDVNGKPYVVLETEGVKVGVFALAGDDFEKLLKPATRPEGAKFSDPVASARSVVAALRNDEKVDVVVLIGHEQKEADEQLARAVSGIDIIFGTHSHIKEELHQIEGTSTWSISPFQYLTYVSRLRVTVEKHKVVSVRGGLLRIDATRPEDGATAKVVAKLQHELEIDPAYAALFRPIGSARHPFLLTDQLNTQTALGTLFMEVVRKAAQADIALSTTSSFRQPLAPGTIRMEDLRAILPYPNRILVYELAGGQLQQLIALVQSKRGTDSYAQMAGIDPAAAKVDLSRTYRVATTDYVARVAGGYKELLAGLNGVDTGLEVRDEVRKYIEAKSPLGAR